MERWREKWGHPSSFVHIPALFFLPDMPASHPSYNECPLQVLDPASHPEVFLHPGPSQSHSHPFGPR